jgi:hypothetical protein
MTQGQKNIDLEALCETTHQRWLEAHKDNPEIPDQFRVAYDALPSWFQNCYRSLASNMVNELEGQPKTKTAGA